MSYSERIEKRMIYIVAVLLCMTLVSLWMVSNMYAKYSTESTGEDGARVALFGHEETITLDKALNTWVPGNSYNYNLHITNGKSEVSVKYNMEIVTAGNLPLEYTLKDSAGKTIKTFTESANQTSDTFDDTSMIFEAGVEKGQDYQLQVKWPTEKNDQSLNGVPDFIQININVEQID